MSPLIKIITSADSAIRDRSLESYCRSATALDLLAQCDQLEEFRRQSDNLYERVRALFFLYAIHRFHLPAKAGFATGGQIPFEGYSHYLDRRFEEAIKIYLTEQRRQGPNDTISSALAAAYHDLGFQTLADQVRHSVRSVRGNQWMFRTGHPADLPLRVRRSLCQLNAGLFPILHEVTPVRMDLTHSGWSDIFFLGMDFPQGARVINTSIDLSVRRDEHSSVPAPPIEVFFRVIDEPVLRLASVDLQAAAELTSLAELFDFARDYLGLLKAAVIASGIVPPGMEGAEQPLADLLARLVGDGHGLEIVSQVNNIPKGSRLAVSTNLLASIISVCMRATGQIQSLVGPLTEEERRLVAARAILGEWLGGSGGGWQDSGGAWPGMKLIRGEEAAPGDPEYGVSRGRLLPSHHIFDDQDVSPATLKQLQESLVLVHGGMAQDVGPILEMVTEKYLLRSENEWQGRREAIRILDEVVALLADGNVRGVGEATDRNFRGPIQTIIPWATNLYTEKLIERVTEEFGADFWGFWMLGGMAGGGMGFIFDPQRRAEAQNRLLSIMTDTKAELHTAVPFAMDPVVYDFSINQNGTFASMMKGDRALMPNDYYSQIVPGLLRREARQLSSFRRSELEHFGRATRRDAHLSGMVQTLFDRLLPPVTDVETSNELHALLDRLGFDRLQHEQIRADLRASRIGLAQNRLPVSSTIEDVSSSDVLDAMGELPVSWRERGIEALRGGEVAVVTLAGGAGSRWTQGAGVVKAINPFARLGGQHRTFLEVHLAKSRQTARFVDVSLPHIVTTSYLTHEPIAATLTRENSYHYPGPLMLSHGRVVGLRMIPMARDLTFFWDELQQQKLDDQAQKMLENLHAALIDWARQMGEGNDYIDNLPLQCLHPVGHWYEIPNLIRNGVLRNLLADRPQLKTLMIHNIDTLGANVDPAILGGHLIQHADLSIEVITRRVEDRGGGLASVDGQPRLIEGLALPREDIEFNLSYYNSNTSWLSIDRILTLFELSRADLGDQEKVDTAVRRMANRMPTYITIKNVKKRWGHGHEDIYPVAQFEKLWGDMTAVPQLDCRYFVVPRYRGQQLKEVAQLDGWLRDGSASYLESICDWT